MNTGEYPVWVNAPNRNLRRYVGDTLTVTIKPDTARFHGHKLKSIYGHWLEETLENWKELRMEFYDEEKIKPVWENNYRKRGVFDNLNQRYIEWLEQKLLDKYNKK